MNEIQALQNGIDSINLTGLTVHEKLFNDKRNTVKKYFLQIGVSTISPSLDYEQMNHFILGFSRAKQILAA